MFLLLILTPFIFLFSLMISVASEFLKTFIFSSDINSILCTDKKFEPNKKLIRDFLLYNITDHTNESFFKGIQKFPKASIGIYSISKNRLKIENSEFWPFSLEDPQNGQKIKISEFWHFSSIGEYILHKVLTGISDNL